MRDSCPSESEDPWSTDSDSDSTHSDRTPNFSKHRNSAGRHNDHIDRSPPRRRGKHGKSSRRHGRNSSSTRSGNSRSNTLVKAAVTLVGKSILKAIKNNLEQRRQNGPRRVYTASDRFKDMHSPPSSPSMPSRDRSPNHPSSSPPPKIAHMIPTITSLTNVSKTLHRSLASLRLKADELHHNLSTSQHGPTSPSTSLKAEGAELLAHCNSLRSRVEDFFEDVEELLTKDEEGRRKGTVSKELRELWKDADGLRGRIDGFVKAQRSRLGREMFY
ncbi:unnamed protein product [Zymoseptoria tritici ST99CH_1A5]|uniref:Uncharacterized protein n=1 Tax=Zymoseptoria tritici ST99CH_1A5 TaxID=1276529 RepID=A0A1Y6LID1_ZYMTR|nr:unnamed protein product [Zymoseptoria tritici ST99CH_1A5]